MMKHVQLSPHRNRSDTISLSSISSYGSSCLELYGNKSYSRSSLNDPEQFPATLKIYARCLGPDIEYKTLSITFQTTAKDVVNILLTKFKMKHRDPKLFYLSMEVTVRKAGVKTHLALGDDARPALLQSCHPKGDSKFSLKMRLGGLVKVFDAVLNSSSQYKCLLISAETSVDELITLLLNCNNSKDRVEQFSLYEVQPGRRHRKLHPDDRPLLVQKNCLPGQSCNFLIKRNPDYVHISRRKLLFMSKPPDLLPSSFGFVRNSEMGKIDEQRKRKDWQVVSKNTVASESDGKSKGNGSKSSGDYENFYYI